MIKFEDHIGLVYTVLSKIKLGNYEHDDLFQEGCIGLMSAIEKFDESKGHKFSTFAMICIRNQIFLSFQTDKWYFGTQAERMKGLAPEPIYLETKTTENTTYYDYLQDDVNIEELITNKMYANSLANLKCLSKREKEVIDLHFYKDYNLREIAQILGCTHQCVQGTRKRALEKLKQMCEMEGGKCAV